MPLRAEVRRGLALVVALLPACACRSAGPVPPHASARAASARATGEATSNVAFSDYAGSAACEPCHPGESAAWQRSPMRRMTRPASLADVRAPFDGRTWTYRDDRVVLERRGSEPWMRIVDASGSSLDYKVTRVIGGRTREDFAGTRDGAGDEVVLPVSYLLASGTFRYKGYSVMVHERDGLRAGPVWRQACIFCHNTTAEVDRLFGALEGGGRPYQSQEVDRWLPVERRLPVGVRDREAFRAAAEGEASRLGASLDLARNEPSAVARGAVDLVRERFGASSLVEIGVGCEACHGGARAHVRDAREKPTYEPVASWLVARATPTRASAINHVCARCHQVLFSRYPFTWEGGRRDALAGGSTINSGEGRDFLLGGCAGAMACTDCHDPHAGGASAGVASLASLDSPSGNRVCTRCHVELGDETRLGAHTHHDPRGPGAACASCHMPRKNMGLSGRLTRYHRIGSPTDPARVLGDRPLECALCHADATVRTLVDTMQSWWPVRYPPERLAEMYGSLDANCLRATLVRGKAHERAVAIAVLGDLRAADAAPAIAARLLDEYPLVREWARGALTRIRGRCDVDLAASDPTIALQAESCGALPHRAPAQAIPSGATDEPAED